MLLSVICYTVQLIPKRFPQSSKYIRIPILAASISFITNLFNINSIESLIFALAEAVVIYISSLAFTKALSPRDKNADFQYGASLMLLLSLALSSFSQIVLFGVLSIGRFFAVLLIMITAYKCGYSKACPLAIFLGISMDLTSGRSVFFLFIYTFTAVISSLCTKKGMFVFSLCYVCANFASALILKSNYFFIPSLYEAFSASIIFMLIPHSILSKYRALFPIESSAEGAVRSRQYIKEKIDLAAEAFKELYTSSKNIITDNANDESIAVCFDRAAEISCRGCKKVNLCWSRDYEVTLDVLNNLSGKMLKNGYIEQSDFPEYFLDRCIHPELFVSSINSELRSLVYRREYKNKFRENLSAAYSHYADMYLMLKNTAAEVGGEIAYDSKIEKKIRKYLRSIDTSVNASAFRDRSGRLHIELFGDCAHRLIAENSWLDELSEAISIRMCTSGEIVDGRLVVLEAEPYCVSVGISSLAKDGLHHGDTGRFFKTDEGILYVILSDGMGSGAGAEKTSREAVKVLELFLRAGLPPEMALKIMSDAFILKNETGLFTATVDLLCIDLFSGSSKIYKTGAAPTYIAFPGDVRRLSKRGFSPGLGLARQSDEDTSMRLNLTPDSGAIIISDGVLGSGDDSWLFELLKNGAGQSPSELAKKITEKSRSLFGKADDITAICVKFETRK